MSTINLLYKQEYAVNDKIKIMIPTVGEVLQDEEEYYNKVSMLTAMPMDYMLQLDEVGIDYTQISEYQLFLLLFSGMRQHDTHLIFGDLDLTVFTYNEEMNAMYDPVNNICIDRVVQSQIAAAIRFIHHLKKNIKKPANNEAKDYLLQRAREKSRRRKSRSEASHLESLIISLVNNEHFKYDYEEVLDLTIYQFNESVRQITRRIDYGNRMHGVYSGTVDPKGMSQDELTWLKI